jgi:hypothetical protein
MCCGFGAVILLFMIISNRITEQTKGASKHESIEVVELSARVGTQQDIVSQKEAELEAVQLEMAGIRKKLASTHQNIQQAAAEIAGTRSASQEMAERIRGEQARRGAEPPPRPRVRQVLNRGNRQYLTGLRMDGKRAMIMIDASGSMLDRTIVNVLIRRNMSRAEQRRAPKWAQVVSTVDWLTANLPPDGQFQVYTFEEKAEPLLEKTRGKWLDVGDGKKLDEVMARLREVVPAGGTSLSTAFGAIKQMKPPPDNIYLLVDGLPTLGPSPSKKKTVSGSERLKYFAKAVRRLPHGIPVNVILYPFEGDPGAASAFWELSIATRGSFMSPSEHWP